MKQVLFLLFPGLEILDFAGPLQAFAEARNLGCDLDIAYCSWQQEICASQQVFINRLSHFTAHSPGQGDLILIPGLEHRAYADKGLAAVPEAVFDWLKTAFRRRAQLCAICSGAFVLGHAGLLDNRSCTTHWSRTSELARTYPRARVKTDCLFVHDSGIYTSAGITAGVDLALALLEAQWGPYLASRVARELVVYIRRNHDHRQKSVYLDYREHFHPGIHKVQDFLITHPGKRHTLEALAENFGFSVRSLTRLFKKATGITIKQYATLIALERAKALLRNPETTVAGVALQCGFHDSRHLRRLWKSHFGTLPSEHMADNRAVETAFPPGPNISLDHE